MAWGHGAAFRCRSSRECDTALRRRPGVWFPPDAPHRRPLRGPLLRPPDAVLPEALRLLMIKSDGSVMVHADTGGYKPQNWMTPPTVIEESDGPIVVRKHAGATEDRLDIRIAEVVSRRHPRHGRGGRAGEGRRRGRPAGGARRRARHCCGEGFRLVRREWPTDIGPVDLMCRDEDDGWIAVEIKRVATIDAVEQLTRYLERIRLDPAMAAVPRRPRRAGRSSRRPGCWPRRAGSPASRSTSRSCAASASPT